MLSTQHAEHVSTATIHADIEAHVIRPVLETVELDSSAVRLLINPTGRFEIGVRRVTPD